MKKIDKNIETEASDYFAQTSTSEFSRDELIKSQRGNPGASYRQPKIRYDNRVSRVEDIGGLSFNTYNWDFAPYMLALKRRVEGNIFPPAAFTRMGLISGETLLRFKIYPNGQMRDLELLEYEGHETLKETSLRAIELSAPFGQLPENFPEPFLEVTGRFLFHIIKR